MSSPNYAADIKKNSFNGQYTADSVVVTLSIGLALFNSLEMLLLISSTFKSWRGLYFWSLSLCNLGVIGYTVGMMLVYFDLCVLWLSESILDIGWMLMISCQSLVLYSRLGLIIDNQNILRAVKWMIISTTVLILPTVVVLDLGKIYSGLSTMTSGYFYIEHVQLTFLTLQELIISGLYVWKTLKLLQVISKANTRSMVRQLFAINIIIIAMDITLVVLQYKHFQLYQESIKAFAYSVKLKLEINILSKLVDLVHGSAKTRSMSLEIVDSNALPGMAQAEVRRELRESENPNKSFASIVKSTSSRDDEDLAIQPTLHASPVTQLDEDDKLTPVMSHHSRFSARTSGRESDLLYADMLRTMA